MDKIMQDFKKWVRNPQLAFDLTGALQGILDQADNMTLVGKTVMEMGCDPQLGALILCNQTHLGKQELSMLVFFTAIKTYFSDSDFGNQLHHTEKQEKKHGKQNKGHDKKDQKKDVRDHFQQDRRDKKDQKADVKDQWKQDPEVAKRLQQYSESNIGLLIEELIIYYFAPAYFKYSDSKVWQHVGDI